ncbi:MAG: RNA polymerase sigma factor [Phycisphaerales bacterium]|nr:RNA polymerase sigma factor [Phycisphaerales bacterium]
MTAAIASGDTEAFARFYERWFDELYNYARSATRRDESFCLDLVQDVMLKVIRNLPPLDAEPVLRLWLRRVLVNTARDRFRTEARRRAREERHAGQRPEAVDDTAPPEEEELQRQLNWLRTELQSMDHALADLITARHRFGWTLARIGATFGLHPSAVDGRTRRATAALQRKATEAFDEL